MKIQRHPLGVCADSDCECHQKSCTWWWARLERCPCHGTFLARMSAAKYLEYKTRREQLALDED